MQSADTLSHNYAVILGRDKALLQLSLVEIGNILLCIQKSINELLVCFCKSVVDDLTGYLIVLRQIAVKFESIALYSFVALLLDVLDYLVYFLLVSPLLFLRSLRNATSSVPFANIFFIRDSPL